MAKSDEARKLAHLIAGARATGATVSKIFDGSGYVVTPAGGLTRSTIGVSLDSPVRSAQMRNSPIVAGWTLETYLRTLQPWYRANFDAELALEAYARLSERESEEGEPVSSTEWQNADDRVRNALEALVGVLS